MYSHLKKKNNKQNFINKKSTISTKNSTKKKNSQLKMGTKRQKSGRSVFHSFNQFFFNLFFFRNQIFIFF